MKIGLVVEHFDPQRGGAERWTFDLASYLLTAGHEVHVVAQDFSTAASQLPIKAHVLGTFHSNVQLAAAAEQALHPLALDVVHDMGVGWYYHILQPHHGSRLAQWERKLQILPAWARPWKQALTRLFPRYRDFRQVMDRQFATEPNRTVLAVSQMVANDCHLYHHVPYEHIRVIYNGVDTDTFLPAVRDIHRDVTRQQLGIEPAEITFLFVGHNFALKGLATAIRALGRLKSEPYRGRLVVVGGKQPGAYLRLAHRWGVADRISFAGRVTDPRPFYAAADAFVLPTYCDSCSLVVLEAAACGLPCITTTCNGASELLRENVDGFVLSDPADDQQLARHMQQLSDPARRAAMGEAARRMALEHTCGRNFREIERLYREVCPAK